MFITSIVAAVIGIVAVVGTIGALREPLSMYFVLRFLDEAEANEDMPPALSGTWPEPIQRALDDYKRTVTAKALKEDANRRAYEAANGRSQPS